MKKVLLLTVFSALLFGCNINPNKEERIRKLETEMQMANEKIKVLEDRIEVLENNLTN